LAGLVLLPGAGGLDRALELLSVRPLASRVLISAATIVCFLGGAELLARVLTEAGILEVHPPMVTVNPTRSDDWRAANIIGDSRRVPDPVLFWRPDSLPPRSSQGFRGPEVETPKPQGVYRIMAYGDSNTEGGAQGTWTLVLERELSEAARELRYEVLNAGCAGYSSYQGIMRFKQEVDEFEPDLVLVSFGWNDLAYATDKSDKEYRPPHGILVAVQRLLIRYQAFRLLTSMLEPPVDFQAAQTSRTPRVSLADYLANMREFAAVARKHGARVIYLTRPHRLSVKEMLGARLWRKDLPGYNDALRAFARENGHELVDVQAIFERQYPGEFVDECHFSGEGHEHLGELLARRLLAAR
ncbi:MAG: SGNH/GDSL hydrolase family protein, partial [Planctomycetota bacterium]